MSKDGDRKSAPWRERIGLKFHVSPLLTQVIALVNGLILTFALFAVLNIFVTDMFREEHERLSRNTILSIHNSMSEIENTMDIVSSLVSMTGSGDSRNIVVSDIRKSVPHLGSFDQMIWVYKLPDGRWQYSNIFEGNSENVADSAYHLEPDHKLIMLLNDRGALQDDVLHLVTDLDGMNYVQEEEKPRVMSRPFAMAKNLKMANGTVGVLVGVSRPSLMLRHNSLLNDERLGHMTIRVTSPEGAEAELAIYDMSRNQADEKAGVEAQQSYDFRFADKNFNILVGYAGDEKKAFLYDIPYIALGLGILLTLVGTLYVRTSQNKSQRLREMNRTLEQKNFELQSEASERERLYEALLKTEKDNRAIIDSIGDIIFETDLSGNVLFMSAAWQKITGFDADQVKGKVLFSLLHPREQEEMRTQFEQFVSGKKKDYRAFAQLRMSDGTFRSVEIAVSVMRQDENGQKRIVGSITDVEERRRVERALAEAEKKYRTIVENAAGGIYQMTVEGIFLSANPAMARILGYDTPEQILREIKNANKSMYADYNARQKFLEDLNVQGILSGHESMVYRKDGRAIWVNENVRAVKDEQGHILFIEGSMEDVTRRKESEMALREAKIRSDIANRAKTEFLANMSHELRTPLNSIIGFSEIMKQEVMGPIGQSAYKEYASDIYKSGRGLLNIINDILDISRIEAGNRELNDNELDFATLVQGCIEHQNSRAGSVAKRIKNETKMLPDLIGEELSLKQAINNVLSNALKFTPSDGTISVQSNINEETGELVLSVSDNGIGMDQDEVQKALSPFGQLDNEFSRSGTGVGLGLTLVKSIMELHGGRIDIQSAKGIGTTVSLIFPKERVSLDGLSQGSNVVSG